MSNVIELIRVSTAGQAALDRASIPAQRATNEKTAQRFGLTIVRSIEMADVSGAAVLHAPEMHDLLRAIESPDIVGVVAREFSRLMRPENFADYILLQAFADTHTVLYLPEGPIDFNSKTGRLMGTIRAAIAGLERSEILERSWSAKEEKRRAGTYGGAPITWPYGVAFAKERGWHYTPKAQDVRRLFTEFLAGNQNYRMLGRDILNGATVRGVKLVLQNPIYTGWRVYTQRHDPTATCRTKADGRQAPKPTINRAPGDIIRVQVIEPIVSEAEFKRVQEIIEVKRRRFLRCTPLQQNSRFVYNGFLTCANCGEILLARSGRSDNDIAKHDDYYVCRGRRTKHACHNPYMRRTRLDSALDSIFANRLTDESFLQEIVSEIEHRQKNGDSRAKLARLQSEVERLKNKRQRIVEMYADGDITAEERHQHIAQIQLAVEQAERKMLDIEPEFGELTAEKLAQILQPFVSWLYLSRTDKRTILSTIVPDIHVADYRVRAIGINPAVFSCGSTDTLCPKRTRPDAP